MSEPILAPEEIEALMAEVAPSEHADALFAALPPLKQPENVDTYNFFTAELNSPDRYPMFINLQERLIEMLDEQWDEMFKRDVSIQLEGIEASIYKDIVANEKPLVYFVYGVEGYGRMMLTFDISLIVAFVDAMLGGEGETSDKPQTLSLVELKLSERIADKLAKTLTSLWSPIHPMDFDFFKLDYDPQFLAVTTALQSCYSVYFDIILSEDLHGQMGVHYPRPFLEPILDTLRVTVGSGPADTDTEWEDAMLDRLSQTSASVRFEMADCKIDIKTFLSLKPGDYLPLKVRSDDPCTLWVESIPLFQAKPGERDGMLAAEITEEIEPGDLS